MKITLIIVKDHGAEPWVAGAWDEYTIDENGAGFADDVREKEAQHDTVRLLVIKVKGADIVKLFETPTAACEVVE